MKILPFLVIALITLNNAYAQELPLWFEEDFKTNLNRWYEVEEYGHKVKHNALYVHADKDFRITTSFDVKRFNNRGKYGIQWGRKNRYYYYFFEVNDNNEFQIGYRKQEDVNYLLRWKRKKKVFQKDENTLEVKRVGEDLIFSINGKKVYDIPFIDFFNSGVAIYHSHPQIKINKFQLYQDMGMINVTEEVENYDVQKQNLGENINSKYIDKAPDISPDGKSLYFIVEDHEEGFGGQDIYFSTSEDGETWSKAQNIGRPLNNQISNFVNAIMPDNNTLMVINAYGQRQDPDEILAFTHRTKDGSWSYPKGTRINQCRKIGRWVSFHLGPDGKTLVFSMLRPDSRGGRDVYVSFLQDNGIFSTPRNLGNIINTTGNEHSPFLAADGKTLYFDSEGHPGYGGRDIFVSRRLDDTWTNWSKPENLGPNINSKGSDEGLIVPASGAYAYFVSDENSYGGLDIYRLRLPQELRPQPTALLSGQVHYISDRMPIETTLRIYKNGNMEEVFARARTNPQTGQYKLALAGGDQYTVIANYNPARENLLDTLNIDLSDLPKYEEKELDTIFLKRIPKEIITPKTDPKTPNVTTWEYNDNINFDVDKYNLRQDAIERLDAALRFLKKHPSVQLEMIGHTDSDGDFEYNWQLATRRSYAVINYLIENGIDPSRLIQRGFGESRPVSDNETTEGRADNRRVELRVFRKE